MDGGGKRAEKVGPVEKSLTRGQKVRTSSPQETKRTQAKDQLKGCAVMRHKSLLGTKK